MAHDYLPETLTRTDADALAGVTVLDFGTDWCGHCRMAQPLVDAVIDARGGDVRHIRIEDGRGRPLGRSYRVKLWPTLVVLRDGEEVARVVRPQDRGELAQALAAAGPSPGDG
ncbi:thioredoxin family protein [Luteimonas yindakuii]|uniref:thioredoxin family protein n=1 Tax=Luteimonas yindakuii TaxID=2565782 RepID=UPI0010A3AF2C|nr:thioredoxin family protein [Luteimonas yindakuii]QCO68419.1 thioredoxin family protein [Luteimonas yindakuii]